ncbi:MAG: carboxylating nicotinate-nucleotide diphosphorylase [Hyphomonadaceae bacterium]|nr:MAG: nicotinate-nucleotide pyrophosphorylase (carboxylating) [Caulobacteraceae bacterium]MBT9444994.1 carboxylating nicotinate-nucleotide diphosphorylase [Hyphomonadaceae bacterium]TPW04794.1 MAG: nicotinate-nucleotide pyrophosphorylase (carboxylating) [Alphaproteobacteria bacterium]
MIPDFLVEPIVRKALEEDLGRAGDVTGGLLRADESLHAQFVARAGGVIAGLQAARIAASLVDSRLVFHKLVSDGARIAPRTAIAEIEGPASSVLTAERTALNFLTHLSGVATLTRAFVDAVAGTNAKIAATRKTLPGLRIVQKAAVIAGGGTPHRYGLDDAILIKDNHIAACGSVGEALRRAKDAAGHMRVVEVEVDSLAQLDEALPHAPHAILLDNFSLDDLRMAVSRAGGKAILEASGGVSLATVRAIAETGVDIVSVGALTHSAPALDIGLDAV